MKGSKIIGKKLFILFAALTFFLGFAVTSLAEKPGGETAVNNLSLPVIWAEGVGKALPGTAGMIPVTEGEWWYWWPILEADYMTCPPDPDNQNLCDDEIHNQANGDPPGEGWLKAYLQKDSLNVWQAESADWSPSPINVNWIDWGDNLESVDWYTKSKVRTEVVLYQNLIAPMLEYGMLHVSGLGADESWGLAVNSGGPVSYDGYQASVYSHCARLTIQKLLESRDDPLLDLLVWNSTDNLWEGIGPEGQSLVNLPVFSGAVYEAEDGLGYYSAEINVKGKVIYGYTWDVRKFNDFKINRGDADGDYRVTFSFDDGGEGLCDVYPNAYFAEGITQIIQPVEYEVTVTATEESEDVGVEDRKQSRSRYGAKRPIEEDVTVTATEESEDVVGATAMIDFTNNLTYIDVRILERTGGGKGGEKGDDTWVDTRGKGAGGQGSGWGGNKN